MTTLARVMGSRRGPWWVLLACLVIAIVAWPHAARFSSVVRNDAVSFLPGDSESVAVSRATKGFAGGELTPALVVFRRDGGLTAADRAAIADARRGWGSPRPQDGALAATRIIASPGGEAAGFSVPLKVHGDAELLRRTVEHIRDTTRAGLPDGLRTAVTGPAGYSADAVTAFEGVNTTLFLAAAALVSVLLMLIHRSPVFWVLPVAAVLLAEHVVRALGVAAAEAGLTINSQTQGIMLVLVFGAGTDYALLLVARYREELRRHASVRAAMRRAIRAAGPSIVASAGTVIAGLAVLTLARVNATSGMGPAGAVAVAVAAAAMLLALPALLVVCGRRVFWPVIPRPGDAPASGSRDGLCQRIGELARRRPRPLWVGTALVLLAMTAGLASTPGPLSHADAFRGDVEAVRGQRMLDGTFPPGVSAPTMVLVPPRADVLSVEAAAASVPGVIAVGSPRRGPTGTTLQVVLADNPMSTAAYDVIPELRRAVRMVEPGAMVGGLTATEKDLADAARHDATVLPPLILLAVAVVLAMLLRAVVAPLMLIATVVLSFAAALGVSMLVFDGLAHVPGVEPSLTLYAFVFLVALGVDYNIFLMARAREEAAGHGTREGMVRSLGVTGSVITSAGIVLAGTFAMLCLLPLWSMFQIGFVVAFGVLVDTFVVRTLLVPALTCDIGPRVWWPSRVDPPRA